MVLREGPLHIPNNVDWTTTPKNGKMVIKEECFKISAADPAIAQVREIEKKNPELTKGKRVSAPGNEVEESKEAR